MSSEKLYHFLDGILECRIQVSDLRLIGLLYMEFKKSFAKVSAYIKCKKAV